MDIKRDLQKCVHCGLCLPACPTYGETGNEAESPRGRIYLIRAAYEGRLDWKSAAPHIDTCLGCLACQTACPSGVEYTNLIDFARGQAESTNYRTFGRRIARRALLRTLTDPGQMRLFTRVMSVITRGVDTKVPRFLSLMISGAPAVATLPTIPRSRYQPPPVSPAKGHRRGRVGMLTGCVMKLIYSPVHRATIEALTANGIEVVCPTDQGCCGALWAHNGFSKEARKRAQVNFAPFRDVDAIVVNSAGCGSTMKEYEKLFEGQPNHGDAVAFATRVVDVSEYLDAIGIVRPARPLHLTVAYHDACHLAHAQGIRAAPRNLLTAIPGLRLVEIEDSDRCCGSAGIYNIVQPSMASRLQVRKVQTVLDSGATHLASANPGCSLWIAQGLRSVGAEIAVVHPIELLARAYADTESARDSTHA